ncbi:Hypothetical predicted protein [Podarcis lilfordi]|uniref:C-type lectin domain-containing protein n=1 Tax=Podarcis lilfordi TaxID=74358 RepID=A0AA35PFR6_9SAUR|nr:Hypothetical predicted protein [Podarcis lilfordi]
MPLEPRPPGAKVVPASSLQAKSQVLSAKSRSAEVRAPPKGPAFWSKSSPQLRRELPKPPSRPSWVSWALQDRIPGPPDVLGISTWWQIWALLLVAVSLALFCTLLILIYNYTHVATEITAESQLLQRSEKRLKMAVQQQAEGRTLTCRSCKRHWMQWGGSCYLHTTEPMSWRDCLSHCKSLKSGLLIGSTEGEMEFLLSQTVDWFMMHNNRLRGGSYWIGLMYNTSDRIWKWADGANLHIRMSGGWQHVSAMVDICVNFRNGDSYIFECSSKHQCLCKKSVE